MVVATGLGALSVVVHAGDLLKEVAVIFITSAIVGTNNREGQTGETTGRERSPAR